MYIIADNSVWQKFDEIDNFGLENRNIRLVILSDGINLGGF